MSRPIAGQLRLDISRLGGAKKTLQRSNLVHKPALGDLTLWTWCGNNTNWGVYPFMWPWAVHPTLSQRQEDGQVRWNAWGHNSQTDRYSAVDLAYYDVTQRRDYGRLRFFNYNTDSMAQTDIPVAIGAFLFLHNSNRSVQYNQYNNQGNGVSFIDLGITQIGAPYMHPTYSTTCSTTAGQQYVVLAGYGASYLGFQHLMGTVRIESGSDRGLYYVHSFDRLNNRTYLRNMDGSKFVAQATAAGLSTVISSRLGYFNETGVIPNSAGNMQVDGLYDAGETRSSFIFRVHFEKSGSPSPSNEAQRGSYWFSRRGYFYGDGSVAANGAYEDTGSPFAQEIPAVSPNTGYGLLQLTSGAITGTSAGTGIVLDRTNQRLWLTSYDITNGQASLLYWNYKSPESAREVATSTGTPNSPLPVPLTLPAAQIRHIDIGADESVYVPLYKAGDAAASGWLMVKPDFSWQMMSCASIGAPASSLYAPVDRSRARSVSSVSTTAAGHVQAAAGAFSSADLGRCIKVSGATADNGTYLISAINSATDVTVTQLNGSAVAFSGGSGGTFQIGDRIYLFTYNDTTWNAGKMSWTDSLAFGVRFTANVTMTAGCSIGASTFYGSGGPFCVDPLSGRVFWYSVDGVKHLNMYDPATGTVTQRPWSDLAVQVPGSSANPTAPTIVHAMAVNTSPYFRELWVGTDQGHYRFDPDNFTAQFARFVGNNQGTYAESDGNTQLDGSDSGYSTPIVSKYGFLPDGQVVALLFKSSDYHSLVRFNRQAHSWTALNSFISTNGWQLGNLGYSGLANTTGVARCIYITPYGEMVFFNPAGKSNSTYVSLNVSWPSAIHYQWIGGQWVPKEVVRGPLPDSVSSPGLSTKPLHSTLEDLVMGVKVKFVSSGAVGGENTEFLGRAAQRGTTRTDGATVSGSANFTGSGFTALNFQASDAGRYYVRIESGASQGVYKILTVSNDNAISLKGFNSTAFSAGATEGSLSYSVWDLQAGAAVGPEVCSFIANVGFARDNTQDISGLYGEFYSAKALLSEQAEGYKFCSDIMPHVGSVGLNGYLETWSADYRASMGAHLPLPSALSNLAVFDGGISRPLDGTGNKPTVASPASWLGTTVSLVRGLNLVLDMGQDVEVGSIIVRGSTQTWGNNGNGPAPISPKAGGSGMITNLLKANDAGGAPLASSIIRCSGTSNLSGTANAATFTTSGDFLGTATAVTGADGVVNPNTIGASVFQSAAGRFSQTNVGMILKVTTGSDVGNYRILAVNGDGSQATIRNLDQTSKTWSGAATGLSFTVYDGVQEEDLICVPSLASPTHRLVVEMLSNDGKTAYSRTYQNATITNQSWQCVKPTWEKLKRLSTSGLTSPPEVQNNGTYVSADGTEDFGATYAYGSAAPVFYGFKTWKAVFDLSDLSQAKRTGRWWKWASQGRDATAAYNNGDHYIHSFEVYDTAGKRLMAQPYQFCDTVYSQAQFLAACFSRVDFIQAADSACPQYAGYNGLANLGGTNGDQVTLAGNASFLGWQVRPRGTGGTIPGGSAVFNAGGSDPQFQTTADVGKFLRIHTGANAGVYRIATVPSATQVTVVTPGTGSAVVLSADAGPVTFSVHEGINTGSSNPDFIFFTTGGNRGGLAEISILAISDDLKTITIGEKQFKTLSNQNWEIRRRALEDRSNTAAVNSAISARLLFAELMYPYQSGDIAQDIKGFLKYWPGDIGGTSLTAGTAVAGTGRFQSSVANVFTQDDVGRLVQITSGNDKGTYRISALNNTSEVQVVNHWTGAAVSFAGGSSLTYKIVGERRLRMSRYVTTLRS